MYRYKKYNILLSIPQHAGKASLCNKLFSKAISKTFYCHPEPFGYAQGRLDRRVYDCLKGGCFDFAQHDILGRDLFLRWLTIILFLISISINTSTAQHYQFTQFYSARMYLNPAFTGVNACSKLGINYRDQWPAIPGAFVTQQVSFEHSLRNAGLGLLVFNDRSGYGGLSSTMVSGLYSYELSINRYLRIRFGLQAGGVSRKINYQSLIFGDQLVRGGADIPTIENPTQTRNYIDLSSGVLFYSKKIWLGISAIHLNQPNQALLEGQFSKLPLEMRVHGGKRFYEKKKKSKWETQYTTIAYNYKMQQEFDQLDIGVYYTYSPLNVGVWYRGIPLLKAYKPGYSNNDAVAILVGISWDRFFAGYSYDMTISKLTTSSGGAHEISLAYNFCDNKRKRARAILISCPKF